MSDSGSFGGAVSAQRSPEVCDTAEEAIEYASAVPPRQGPTMKGVPFDKHGTVRVGSIGVGGRGGGQLREMLAVEGARVVAVADVSESVLAAAVAKVTEAGQPAPATHLDWKKVCEADDVDLVYICTGWELHVPMAVYAMECGKHVAVEVPAAVTLADCWQLVDTSEKTRRHCVQLENCCYGQQEMMVLNLVKEGKLGTLTHGEAAYIHEMRRSLLGPKTDSSPNWRRRAITANNGNLYPTHGLGPVAQYMGIHDGDRFVRMVSMSSPSAALTEMRDALTDADDPRRAETYVNGDMSTSVLQTAQGRTVLLQHDIVTPRPYSRANLLQGSKGTFSDYPPRLFLDHGITNQGEMGAHEWQEAGEGSAVLAEFHLRASSVMPPKSWID
eukprot:COSAG01_NODE_4156_length_5291_cov_4.177196_10_plen_386_part_00